MALEVDDVQPGEITESRKVEADDAAEVGGIVEVVERIAIGTEVDRNSILPVLEVGLTFLIETHARHDGSDSTPGARD